MGRPIVYCSDCGRSLREEDFQKGHAAIFENRPFCSTCRKIEAPPPPSTPSGRSVGLSGRTPKPFAAAPTPKKSSTPLLAAAFCGVAVIVLILGVTLSGRRPPPPPPEPAKAETPPAPPPLKEVVPEVVDRAAAEKERADRFERYLKDIRAALDDARFDDRREEIRVMIAKAGEMAGARQSEVDGLHAIFTRRSKEAGLRQGLIAHYKLDDLSGTVAADASGSGFAGKVVGKGTWTAARIGSGFETFGGGEHVELPDTEVLRSLQKGAFSVAAWYQPNEDPTGGEVPTHGIVVKAGNHLGLLYNPGGFFRFDVWQSTKNFAVIADRKLPPGRFYHLAGTWQPETGAGSLYVDGALMKTRTAPPNSSVRSYGAERWRIGVARGKPDKYQSWSKGILDDVRLYSRALSADDIRFLYESAPQR